jgi:WD40 repeat protein
MRTLTAAFFLGLATLTAVAEPGDAYVARVSAAHALIRLGEPKGARRFLDAVPPDRRDTFEWRYLNAQCDTSVSRFGGAGGTILALGCSRDGSLIASAEGDKRVRIMTPAGDVKHNIELASEPYTADFNDDGTLVATPCRDTKVYVWKVEDGSLVATLEGHYGPVASAAFQPGGGLLVSTSWAYNKEEGVKGDIRIWSTETWAQTDQLFQGEKPLLEVRFTPDGKRMVVASWDHTCTLWDVDKRDKICRLEGPEQHINSADITREGIIAAGSDDGTVRIWDSAGNLLHTTKGHHEGIFRVRFTPDGKQVLSASLDGTVRVWDAATGGHVATLLGHSRGVRALTVLPDGRAFTGGLDRQILEWNVGTAGSRPHNDPAVYSAVFTPDGRRIAVAGGKAVRIHNYWTGQQLADIEAPGIVITLEYATDGRRLLVTGIQTGRIVDADTGATLVDLKNVPSRIEHATFSPDCSQVLVVGPRSVAGIWDAATGARAVELIGHNSNLYAGAWTADGEVVATCDGAAAIRLWTKAGKPVATLEGHRGAVYSLGFSRDGQRLFSAGQDGDIHVWDVAEHKPVARWKGHDSSVTRIALSPDGTRLASSSRSLNLWDTTTGEPLLSTRPNPGTVYCASWSPDGSRIAQGDWTGVWGTLETLTTPELRARRVRAAKAAKAADEWLAAQTGTNADDLALQVRSDTALDSDTRGARLDAIMCRVGK